MLVCKDRCFSHVKLPAVFDMRSHGCAHGVGGNAESLWVETSLFIACPCRRIRFQDDEFYCETSDAFVDRNVGRPAQERSLRWTAGPECLALYVPVDVESVQCVELFAINCLQ